MSEANKKQMKVFISVDMEGVSGVTRWEDVSTRGQDYQRARSWMTADVNAAVAGARAAGATEIVVEENHGVEMLCNLVLDEIDPDVEVVRGLPRGGATTIAALDGSCDAMLLVGHHAAAGDYPGICAHTISYGGYKVVRCNGQPISEGEIFATVAAAHSVPTALIAGDDVVSARMEKFVPGIETACVKRALSRTAGAIIPPVHAHGIIRDAAERAVRRRERDRASRARAAVPLRDRTASAAQRRSPHRVRRALSGVHDRGRPHGHLLRPRHARVLSACGSHVVYRRGSRVGAHLLTDRAD